MTALALGISLGLAAGLAPGPLHALVLTASMQRGFGAGARVALAPLVTDVPIVLLSIFAVGALPAGALPYLAAAGGAFLGYLGFATIREAGFVAAAAGAAPPRDLRRGIIANALSPHPWLFWIGVGGPLLIDAAREGAGIAFAFLGGFYGLLIGTKVALAYGAARAGRHLGAGTRRIIVTAGGSLLIALGAVLVYQAATGRF